MERRQLCSETHSGAHDLFKGGKERVASMSWFPRATEPHSPQQAERQSGLPCSLRSANLKLRPWKSRAPPSRWVSEASQPTEHLCLGRVVERLGGVVPTIRGPFHLGPVLSWHCLGNQDGLSAFVGGPESETSNQN